MKKTYLVLFLFATINSFSQKLEENKKDEFTNQLIKSTSWENFAHKFSMDLNYRIVKIDSSAAINNL